MKKSTYCFIMKQIERALPTLQKEELPEFGAIKLTNTRNGYADVYDGGRLNLEWRSNYLNAILSICDIKSKYSGDDLASFEAILKAIQEELPEGKQVPKKLRIADEAIKAQTRIRKYDLGPISFYDGAEVWDEVYRIVDMLAPGWRQS